MRSKSPPVRLLSSSSRLSGLRSVKVSLSRPVVCSPAKLVEVIARMKSGVKPDLFKAPLFFAASPPVDRRGFVWPDKNLPRAVEVIGAGQGSAQFRRTDGRGAGRSAAVRSP